MLNKGKRSKYISYIKKAFRGERNQLRNSNVMIIITLFSLIKKCNYIIYDHLTFCLVKQ